MTLNEHYKFHSRKSLKPYTRLLIFIVLIVTVFHTLARYTSFININTSLGVAKWSIYINDIQVTNNTSFIQSAVNVTPDAPGETSIGAGETGYFDIKINPSLTEVSINYTIKIDLSNLPAGTTITSCDLYQGTSTTNPTSVSVLTNGNGQKYVEGNISVSNNQALSSSDIKRYRVHCRVDNNVIIDENDLFSVMITVEGQQII